MTKQTLKALTLPLPPPPRLELTSPLTGGLFHCVPYLFNHMFTVEMTDAICVYVPENSLADTQYVHFYPYEMTDALKCAERLQNLHPEVPVAIFIRQTSIERIEDERSLR